MYSVLCVFVVCVVPDHISRPGVFHIWGPHPSLSPAYAVALHVLCVFVVVCAVHVRIPSPGAPHIWGPHQGLSSAHQCVREPTMCFLYVLCVQYTSTPPAQESPPHLRPTLGPVSSTSMCMWTNYVLFVSVMCAVHVHIPSPGAPHIWGPHQGLSPAHQGPPGAPEDSVPGRQTPLLQKASWWEMGKGLKKSRTQVNLTVRLRILAGCDKTRVGTSFSAAFQDYYFLVPLLFSGCP